MKVLERLQDCVGLRFPVVTIGNFDGVHVGHQAVLKVARDRVRSQQGTAVVLIIDKSSSMEGRKIELARLAAIGVVENLRPIDSVGVLIFDNSFQWAVPIRKADDRAAKVPGS